MSSIQTLIEEKLKKGEKESRRCLDHMSLALNTNEYLDLYRLVYSMNENTLSRLEDAVEAVKFDKKRFCQWVSSGKREAKKKATKERSIGYEVKGEFGGEYGYFKYLKPLTEEQEEWLEEYKECCYHYGQPCARWQDEENCCGEDCECVLGREYCSLMLTEIE
jgi:hypothetical protein